MILLQALIDGILIGGVYASIAAGLSLSFGVMRMINWASGELLMLSMYISYVVLSRTGLDPYLAMFLSAGVMALFGIALQSGILNRLLARETAREPISLLLFTSGLGMFITNAIICTVGATPLSIQTRYSGKTLNLFGILFSVPRLISCVIAVAVLLSLFLFLRKSETGRAIRATSQDRNVAMLMGINQSRVYNIAFAISLALVGMAGALLIPYYPVGTTVGATFSFKAFIIVVLGGKGSVIGALLGGLIIGIVEKVVGTYSSDTNAQIAIFVIFLVVLLIRPNGLLGEKS